jgi:hypothetical protein
MITSLAGLRLAFDQLRQTYQALFALQAAHPDASPQWLSVMAEGFIDHARQVQHEIDAYRGTALTEGSREHLDFLEQEGIIQRGDWGIVARLFGDQEDEQQDRTRDAG